MLSRTSIPETPGEKPAPEIACKVVAVKASIGPKASTNGFNGATKPAVEQFEIHAMKPGRFSPASSAFFNLLSIIDK